MAEPPQQLCGKRKAPDRGEPKLATVATQWPPGRVRTTGLNAVLPLDCERAFLFAV